MESRKIVYQTFYDLKLMFKNLWIKFQVKCPKLHQDFASSGFFHQSFSYCVLPLFACTQ